MKSEATDYPDSYIRSDFVNSKHIPHQMNR